MDGGFTCPNRDGKVAWGGCTYCNNESFRPDGVGVQKSIEQQIQDGTAYLTRRFKARRFIVYWQNFSNTYASAGYLRGLYEKALACDDRIIGMAIGTRPDCIEDDKLEMIGEVAGNRYVCMEYGLESISDETLQRINRGHDVACYRDAVSRTRHFGFDICCHVILGFPWESYNQLMEYPDVLNELGVQFVKLHHLHVVSGTQLAREYLEKPFPTFIYQDWISTLCDVLERLDPQIVVQRLFGWAPYRHLIAPRWDRTRAEILLAVDQELERRGTEQGSLFALRSTKSA